MQRINFRILAVGKVKERFYRTGIEHYLIRLKPYCNINITEFAESGRKEKAKALEEEAVAIGKHARGGAQTVALAAEGRAMASEEFARYIEKLLISGKVRVDFIIGGPLGLSAKIKKKADLCLSLSALTFPHRLARLILLEQLYRCFKIIRGEPYHK